MTRPRIQLDAGCRHRWYGGAPEVAPSLKDNDNNDVPPSGGKARASRYHLIGP